MEPSPSSKATTCSATREIPIILWNLSVHHRVHKGPPRVSNLSQMNPICITPYYFSKIHFNIILSYTSRCP
jgi:hypothetical protein